jgi:DNA (cytosine-5)-methyltransferase 1
MTKHKFPYNWTLEDSKFTKDKGTVFSCFACGGGSTMGYKLAGFDVIGCNEIDPRMAEIYKENHNPKYLYIEPIQTFKLREDLPEELYNLDILDGSPPCSNFSMVGNREKDWGKLKKFAEGQATQVLDTLFFDFIDLAKNLQPKVVIAENVKGLLLGNAKSYVDKILIEFDKAGYYVQYKLLDASDMGVPQRRERVFFIAFRKDLAKDFLVQLNLFDEIPLLTLDFNEPKILFNEIKNNLPRTSLSTKYIEYWEWCIKNDKACLASYSEFKYNKRLAFSYQIVYNDTVCYTLTSSKSLIVETGPGFINDLEIKLVSSFPTDYNFLSRNVQYVCGMSVPPVMVANIATNIYQQWLSKLK